MRTVVVGVTSAQWAGGGGEKCVCQKCLMYFMWFLSDRTLSFSQLLHFFHLAFPIPWFIGVSRFACPLLWNFLFTLLAPLFVCPFPYLASPSPFKHYLSTFHLFSFSCVSFTYSFLRLHVFLYLILLFHLSQSKICLFFFCLSEFFLVVLCHFLLYLTFHFLFITFCMLSFPQSLFYSFIFLSISYPSHRYQSSMPFSLSDLLIWVTFIDKFSASTKKYSSRRN